MDLYSGLFSERRFLDRGVFEVTNMSEIDKADPHGCDNGALTDRFGVLIQGLLAIVAFSTLMGKFLLPQTAEPQRVLFTEGWSRTRKRSSPRGALLTFEELRQRRAHVPARTSRFKPLSPFFLSGVDANI